MPWTVKIDPSLATPGTFKASAEYRGPGNVLENVVERDGLELEQLDGFAETVRLQSGVQARLKASAGNVPQQAVLNQKAASIMAELAR